MKHDETRHSTVMIAVDEDADRTRATAHLPWRSTTLVGLGIARMDADDAHAVARALSNLANQLFATSMSEIDADAVRRPPLATFQRR